MSINVGKAIALQKKLAERVLSEFDTFKKIDPSDVKLVAGVDAAYKHGVAVGVAVLIDYRSKQLISYSVVKKKPPLPYIPGLLAFREAPVYISALRKLKREPDVVFVDGHGLSHPRAMGIATHIGLVLNKPSIGVAKKRLFGRIVDEGSYRYLVAHDLRVGVVIRHKGKDLYVSIGYKIDLNSVIRITKELLDKRYPLPLPTAIADLLSKKIAHT